MSTASVAPAVKAAAEDAQRKLIAMAVADRNSPLYGAQADAVHFEDGDVALIVGSSKSENFSSLLRRNGNRALDGMAAVKPQLNFTETPCHSFGAIFTEVAVDADLGTTRVKRVVAVYESLSRYKKTRTSTGGTVASRTQT